MKFKTLAIVAALVASAGAQANVVLPNSSDSGSVIFTAMNVNAPISVMIDLGYGANDFLGTAGAGLLTAGTTVVWDFNANTRTVNGAASTLDANWSGNFASFLQTSGTGNNGQIVWGVMGADNLGSTEKDLLTTGNATATQMGSTAWNAAKLSSANGVMNTFMQTNLTTAGQTHLSDDEGSSVAASGGAYLNTTLKNNLNTNLPWNMLVANGASSTFQHSKFATNVSVFQLGSVTTADAALQSIDNVATFTFDADAGTLTYAIAAVPEPQTYALMLAGLGAIGFLARRRRAV